MIDAAVRNPIRKAASKLTPKKERFARRYFEIGNGCAAYREVFSARHAKRSTVKNQAFQLLRVPAVKARIRELQAAAAQDAVFNVRERMLALHEIANADASEISRVVTGACRHCHGKAGGFQWIDQDELNEAIEKAQLRIEAGAKRVHIPTERGGFGFDASRPPREGCRRCAGNGLSRVVITPTSEWSPAARKLFKAARQRSDGTIELELESRQAASEQLAKLAGWNVDRSVSLTAHVNVPIPDSISPAEALEFLKTLAPA